jgi:hypothetical protein
MDTCLWLLERGVAAERIRWIMPRDAWWIDRVTFQLSDAYFDSGVGNAAAQMEALAQAASLQDLFDRLEASGALLRLDRSVKPTMFHGASISTAELAALRRIGDIVRLGRVQRIEADKIVLAQGELPAGADDLYIDCSANGVGFPAPIPVFAPGRITVQMLKIFQPSFSAALIAHVEAAYADDRTRNDLCRAVTPPQYDTGWLLMMAGTLSNTARWSVDADLMAWIMKSRLDPLPKLMRNAPPDDKARQALIQRVRTAVKPAAMNMRKLLAELSGRVEPARTS